MQNIIHTGIDRMLKKRCQSREPSDHEVRSILVSAMADVGAHPALVFAFATTGVYVSSANERTLPRKKIAAWNAAIQRYFELLGNTEVV